MHIVSVTYTQKPRPPGTMQLRTHSHHFELPTVRYEYNKGNFIVWLLFNYVFFFKFYYPYIIVSVLYYKHVQLSYVLNSYIYT